MKKEKKLNIYWIYFVLVAVLIGISILDFDNKIEKISWNQLETLAESKAIKSLVIVNKKTVKVVLNTPPFSPAAQEVIGEHNKDVKALKISAVLPQEDFIKDLILWGKEYHFSVDFSD